MVCTFFGHKDTPNGIAEKLKETIKELIENHNVDKFYVGNNGNFDRLVYLALKDLTTVYKISFEVVLAYLPTEKSESEYEGISSLPEGIENVPKRFAISYRNKWMINESDYVITYVKHSAGGASKFKEMAQRKGKTVINL